MHNPQQAFGGKNFCTLYTLWNQLMQISINYKQMYLHSNNSPVPATDIYFSVNALYLHAAVSSMLNFYQSQQ